MSKIVTICEQPKPHLSARHGRDDESVFETFLCEDLNEEGHDLLHPLSSSGRRPQRRSALGAYLEKEQHITPSSSRSANNFEASSVPWSAKSKLLAAHLTLMRGYHVPSSRRRTHE